MIHRLLLALLCCLLALAAPVSAHTTASRLPVVPTPVALFAVEFSDTQDCGPLTLHLDGLHHRAGPCGGVLVRQNPWSKFDPEGLFEWKDVGNSLVNTGASLLNYGNDLLGSAYEILSIGTNGTNSSQQFTDKTLNMVRGAGDFVTKDAGRAMHGVVNGIAHGDFEQAFDQGMSALGETHEEQVASLITLGVTARLARFLKAKGGAAEPPATNAPAVPTEPYNRKLHYGRTPTAADRKAVGAVDGEVADHEPPLVKRYYEGDPATGEKPGYQMTPEERRESAGDQSRMKPQPRDESNAQGGEMSQYSKKKKKEHGL
jgi:hypothetical protein